MADPRTPIEWSIDRLLLALIAILLAVLVFVTLALPNRIVYLMPESCGQKYNPCVVNIRE